MNIRYIGEVANSTRLAVIGYNEEKETEKAYKVMDKLVESGWRFAFEEDGDICFEVIDRCEYNQFVQEYKKFKNEV